MMHPTSTSPVIPKLPTELYNLIIDILGDDKDQRTGCMPESTANALKNCALASRHWYPRAMDKLQYRLNNRGNGIKIVMFSRVSNFVTVCKVGLYYGTVINSSVT